MSRTVFSRTPFVENYTIYIRCWILIASWCVYCYFLFFNFLDEHPASATSHASIGFWPNHNKRLFLVQLLITSSLCYDTKLIPSNSSQNPSPLNPYCLFLIPLQTTEKATCKERGPCHAYLLVNREEYF